MDNFSQEKEGKKKITEVTTYTIPFTLEANLENLKNLTISTNTSSKPSKAEIMNQAFKFHSKGKILEALKYYKSFINQGFIDPIIFSNYGTILQDLGNLEGAEVSLRKAIEIKPEFAEAHSNLGNILKDLGNLEGAEVSLRKAIELNPNSAMAHYNLGIILSDLGNLKDAELSYRKTIKINPYFANAHNNLGNTLRDLGNLKDAELFTRKAIEINPYCAEAHSNLGNILSDLGNLKDAELSYNKAIELKPDFAEAYSNLGIILKDLGKSQDAELSYRKAIEINPNYAEAYYNLGIILKDLDKLQEVEFAYRKAIEINPNLAIAYFNLFHHYEQINNLRKLKESLKDFRKINNIENELIIFHARLDFRNKEYKAAQELMNRVSTQWIEKSNNREKTIFWSYKAFIEDKIGNYDVAYSCFKESQDDSLYLRFNKDSYLNFIDSYKESVINKKIIVNNFNDGIEDSTLAFLIGFPRSGTTLLDTILRSHKDIEVIEEKPLIATIEKLIQEKFNKKLENIFSISGENLIMLRKEYFKLLKKYKTKNVNLFVDKLPLNTVSLPLINLIFPNAKIIFAHRQPYDTVLSCFQQSFKPNNAMANLISLKSSSIMFDQVMNAWDIYKNNLPINFITSKYENIIEDFDGHTLEILEFLGVGWDENVRNYRKTALDRGKINTPSSSQVVQPLYKSSIDKWKNYEKYFEDCHQYLEKWISYFDY